MMVSIFFLTFLLIWVDRVHADLLVVLLQGRQILPGLGEFSLLHALADVPEKTGQRIVLKTLRVTEKDKIYGSIFSVISLNLSFQIGNVLLFLFLIQHSFNFLLFDKKGVRKVL